MDKIGIIGYGNMGQAIAQRLKIDYSVYIFDKDEDKTRGASDIKKALNYADLISGSDVIILAVKPQDFDSLLSEIKNAGSKINLLDKLIISIAAGITTGYVEEILGTVRLIRVMPNMPAKIGQGMTCLCKGKFASEQDFDFAENLFDYLGETLRIEEKMMAAATAVSGSGPALVCEGVMLDKKREIFLKDFQKAAEGLGFNAEEAELLTKVTFDGTIKLLEETRVSPSELIKQVASKGGTTEAALEVLHKGGSLEEAVKAAEDRAKELSRKEK